MKVNVYKIMKGNNDYNAPRITNISDDKNKCLDPIIIGTNNMEFYINKPCYVRLSINCISTVAVGPHHTIYLTTLASSMIDLFEKCKHFLNDNKDNNSKLRNEFVVENIINLGEEKIYLDTASGICMDILYTRIPMTCIKDDVGIVKFVKALLLSSKRRREIREECINRYDYYTYIMITRVVDSFKCMAEECGFNNEYIITDPHDYIFINE